jgi:DNA-binding MarR family transcriptional regulator
MAEPPGDVPALTETERMVMRVVDLTPGLTPSEIADRSVLQRPNVSAALRSLEAKGLVDRTERVGRNVVVRPTEAAASSLERLRTALRKVMEEAMEGTDTSALLALSAPLRELEQRLFALRRPTGTP